MFIIDIDENHYLLVRCVACEFERPATKEELKTGEYNCIKCGGKMLPSKEIKKENVNG